MRDNRDPTALGQAILRRMDSAHDYDGDHLILASKAAEWVERERSRLSGEGIQMLPDYDDGRQDGVPMCGLPSGRAAANGKPR